MAAAQDKKDFAFARSDRIKSSVQKINLVADLIRGTKVSDALLQLRFSNRAKVAKKIQEVLSSAVSNAENNHGLDIDKLYVDRVMVGKALVLKRFRARAKGRAGRIEKPFSNVTIYVQERN